MRRPTKVQRRVLAAMAEGSKLLRPDPCVEQFGAVLAHGDVDRVQDQTFVALEDRGWIWMTRPGVWELTAAGCAALAAKGGRA